MSKQDVLNVVNTFPEDITFDEVIYRLYVISSVKEGLTDIENGNVYTQEEMEKMFAINGV